MRIIAGLAKGRNLVSPFGATRPTSDRAREALFSSLESEFGNLHHLNFLDLFSGSGAVAAEALSRGAALVHAVENDEKAQKVIRQNFSLFDSLSGVGTYQLFPLSVQKFLEKVADTIRYDIIFIDPPYDMVNKEVEKIVNEVHRFCKDSAVIAVERDARTEPFHWPAQMNASKVRKYGHAVIYYGSPAQNG